MKRQLFLSILTVSALLVGSSIDHAASAQNTSAMPRLFANTAADDTAAEREITSEPETSEAVDPFEALELTPEQRAFVEAEMTWLNQALMAASNQATAEGRELTEAELQALEAEFLSRLSQQLSPEQIQQIQARQAQLWEPSPEELAQLQQETFEYFFAGIDLTPEQEQYLRTEIDQAYQARLALMVQLIGADPDVIEAQIQALDEVFYARLQAGLTPEQIQQMQENETLVLQESALPVEQQMALLDFRRWFRGIELTAEQEQFIVAELTRYHDARFRLMDDVAQVLAAGGNPDDEFQALHDQLLALFEDNLNAEQLQQFHNNYP